MHVECSDRCEPWLYCLLDTPGKENQLVFLCGNPHWASFEECGIKNTPTGGKLAEVLKV